MPFTLSDVQAVIADYLKDNNVGAITPAAARYVTDVIAQFANQAIVGTGLLEYLPDITPSTPAPGGGWSTSGSILAIAVTPGTYTDFLDVDGDPLVISGDTYFSTFYKADGVDYWAAQNIDVPSPPDYSPWIDFTNRRLVNASAQPTIDWENNHLVDGDNFSALSWGQRILRDTLANPSLDWANGILFGAAGDRLLEYRKLISGKPALFFGGNPGSIAEVVFGVENPNTFTLTNTPLTTPVGYITIYISGQGTVKMPVYSS